MSRAGCRGSTVSLFQFLGGFTAWGVRVVASADSKCHPSHHPCAVSWCLLYT